MPGNSDTRPLLLVTAVVGGMAAVVLGIGLWIASFRPELMVFFAQEDGLLEWLAFLALLSASLSLCFFHYVKRARDGLRWTSVQSLGMLILAAILLFGALEEISWGQRLFHWRAPEFFQSRNLQQETNIHNLEIGGIRINRVVFDRLLFLLMVVHNVVLPVVASRRRGIYRWAERIGGFLPPLPLVVVYVLGTIGAYAAGIPRPSEIPEALGGVHYLASILLTYGLGYGVEAPVIRTALTRRLAAPAIALWLVALLGLSWVLAVT